MRRRATRCTRMRRKATDRNSVHRAGRMGLVPRETRFPYARSDRGVGRIRRRSECASGVVQRPTRLVRGEEHKHCHEISWPARPTAALISRSRPVLSLAVLSLASNPSTANGPDPGQNEGRHACKIQEVGFIAGPTKFRPGSRHRQNFYGARLSHNADFAGLDDLREITLVEVQICPDDGGGVALGRIERINGPLGRNHERSCPSRAWRRPCACLARRQE